MLSIALETLVARVDGLETASAHGAEEVHSSVHTMVAAAASFYEKVRYLLDYREEHMIRRAAVERIVHRLFFIERKSIDARTLLTELSDSKYISPTELTQHLEDEVQHTLERFSEYYPLVSEYSERKMLASFASTEIESHISAFTYGIDIACADALYETLLSGDDEHHSEGSSTGLQLYCAAYRALLRFDDESLSYALWQHAIRGVTSEEIIPSETLRNILHTIDHTVHDNEQWEMVRNIKTETILFKIIRHLFLEKGKSAQSILRNDAALSKYAEQFVLETLEKENRKISYAGLRAVAFLLMTKFIMVFVVELPYDYFVLGQIGYVPLIINLLFHPSLLYILTRRVSVPGEENATVTAQKLLSIVHGKSHYHLEAGHTSAFRPMFWMLYALIPLGVFGALVTVLGELDFTIVSGIMFVFFFALVMYFAFRIRYRASQWQIVPDRSVGNLLLQTMISPVIRTGRYLSQSFKSINILVVVMDFIIESPFRFVLNFSKQFLDYLGEKVNDVY